MIEKDKTKTKYFDEEWPKEEEILRISYEHSKRMMAERLNKTPRQDLHDEIQKRNPEIKN